MKKILVVWIAAAVLVLSCTAKKTEPEPSAILWTDSAGRAVELPAKITRIAPSGALAQIILYTLCPDRVMGWASEFSASQKKYIDAVHWSKPVFGQFYGRGSSLNMEALIAAAPDIIIDLGERKASIKEDMDGIQAQTGIPVVFIEAELETMGEAYLALGRLLGESARAGELADYVDGVLKDAAEKRARIKDDARVGVYFGQGKRGEEANARGIIHADVIEYAGGINVAVVENTSMGMAGVSMEQIILWNTDVVLFGSEDAYLLAASDPAWQPVKAIQDKKYYYVPAEPYGWMGRPPSVNRLIGIRWLGNLLYPDIFNYDIISEAKTFYKTFYHYDLSDAEAAKLLEKSGG